MNTESKPITGGEWYRFLHPGESDEYDHDREAEEEEAECE